MSKDSLSRYPKMKRLRSMLAEFAEISEATATEIMMHDFEEISRLTRSGPTYRAYTTDEEIVAYIYLENIVGIESGQRNLLWSHVGLTCGMNDDIKALAFEPGYVIADNGTYQMGYWGRGEFSADVTEAEVYPVKSIAEVMCELAKTGRDPHPNAKVIAVECPRHLGPFADRK